MKPIEFEGFNTTFAKDQPPYLPLPAYRHNSEAGEVITCWKLSFKEKIKILLTGKLWLKMLSFNKPLTQVFLTTNVDEVLTYYKEPE